MANPTASELEPDVKKEFSLIGERLPKPPAVPTIARVVAGRLGRSLGAWPASTGFVRRQTVAFFVDVYAKRQTPPPDAALFASKVNQVLPNQFLKRGRVPPEARIRVVLVRLTVGALLQHRLPLPKAAPLDAASLMTELYLEGEST